MVNTDEGPKQPWTTEDEDFTLMRYTLMEAAKVAEPRGILIGLECHQQYSKHPDGLDRIARLVKSPAIGINFDTGNAFLCGHDPYKWLKRVVERLVHLHAKDISVAAVGSAERGKVTGTAGRLRLRRRRDRLGPRHPDVPQGETRHCPFGRMRHDRAGRTVDPTSPGFGLRKGHGLWNHKLTLPSSAWP